jgi:hypothetical protein
MSKGGLVYSFATKDGLVRAALEREVSRFQIGTGYWMQQRA